MEAFDAKRKTSRAAAARRLILLWVGLTAGCSSIAPPTSPATSAVEPAPIFCAYDIVAPRTQSGQLTGYFGEHGEDCIPPEGGSVFSVGFGLGNGDYFKLTVPRVTQPVGRAITDLRPGVIDTQPTWHVIGMIHTNTCTEWTGEVIVQGDLPKWSVYLDVTCIADSSMHVQGQLSN